MINTRPSPLFVVLSLLVLAVSVLRGEAVAATPGEVLTLNADNFAGAIKKHAFIAVEFYAPVRTVFVHTFLLLLVLLSSFLFFSAHLFPFPAKPPPPFFFFFGSFTSRSFFHRSIYSRAGDSTLQAHLLRSPSRN